ncbi:MAG: carbohydrate ABC transporter permease [Anaerolineae bacterium]
MIAIAGRELRARTISWRKRRWLRHALTQAGAHLVLIVMGLLFSIPFVWLVSSSLKPSPQLFKVPPVWIPNPIVWSNYPKALTYIPYIQYLKNTLYICAFNVLATLLSCSFVAYGFSRVQWPAREAFFLILISTLMLPYAVTMIPQFLLFKHLGWVGSYAPLTVPALTGSPFFIFLLRQFYMGIPLELSDAARIDGCNEYGIYARIVLPLARPALATVGLFSFMANWNDFLGPLIYIKNQKSYTIALGLFGFLSTRRTEWALFMAAATVTIAPVIVIFFFTQRTFIQGITLTGLKA